MAKEYEGVPHYLSVKKQMPHYFIHTDYRAKKCPRHFPFEHDILLKGMWAWARKTDLVVNHSCAIPQKTFTSTPSTSKPANPSKEPDNRECNFPKEEQIDKFRSEILDNINLSSYHEYADWCKFIWAIKFSFPANQAQEMAVLYSKLEAEKYGREDWSEEVVLNKMEEAKEARIGWEFKIHMQPSQIDFDTYKPYYFCFTNCAYDLRTNCEVQVKREDYITQTAGYAFVNPSNDQVEKIKQLFQIIFPKEEERKCYISILRCNMIALLFEYFVLANGSGGNGKGLVNSLFKRVLGSDYFYTANVATYTEKLKEGANPAVANMNKKRCIVTSEPKDTEKLNLGAIKQFTGEGEINARGLYEKNTEVVMWAIHILECNKKPGFDGRIDDSIIRRFINIQFRSTFTNDESKLNLPNYHKADGRYKTKEWQEEYKCAFFDYLLQYDYIDVYIPACVRKDTYDYLCENDDFTVWIEQHYELVEDKKKTVKLSAMCKRYKETFLRVGSREYKKMTAVRFLEKLKENIKGKEIVAERYKEHEVKGKWFVGMGEKPLDESDSEGDY